MCSEFQLKEVNRHPWVIAGGKGELELEDPMMDVVQTHIIPGEDTIDEDVFLVTGFILLLLNISSFSTTAQFDKISL